MDFRNISPSSLCWKRGTNGVIYANRQLNANKKIQFQIPKCNCDIQVHSPGMFRMELVFNENEHIHIQFLDWIKDLEQSCKGPWKGSKSPLIYNNKMRLMFFADTNAFNADGVLSADYFSAKSVHVLVSLVGLWSTEDKHGLKFKVDQFKFFEDRIDYPGTPNECDLKNDLGDVMFVDDD